MDLYPGHGGRVERSKFFGEVGDSLCNYVDITIRYNSPDETGETRREFNARFGEPSPEPEITSDAVYLLDVFEQLTGFRDYTVNGDPLPLMPGIIEDWCRATGTLLLREEKSIIYRVDAAYREACRNEQIRQHDLAMARRKINNG